MQSIALNFSSHQPTVCWSPCAGFLKLSHPVKPPLVYVGKNLKDCNGCLSLHLICLEEGQEVAQ